MKKSPNRGIINIMTSNKGFIGLAVIILAAALLVAGVAYVGIKQASTPKTNLGTSFTPVQAGKTTLSGAGVTANATTINLTSLLLNDGITAITMSNFGSIGFATIEPGVPKKEENVSFTGITQNANGTAALTGVTRGLLPVSPYTASTTLAIAHSGGSTLIISNSAAFYNQFAIANNSTTIAASWTFNSSTLPKVTDDTTNAQVGATTSTLATVGYVNSVASSGAANASEIVNGLAQFATIAQTVTGTSAGSTGALLVPQNKYFNSSSTATTTIPVSDNNGKLDPNFINQASNYNFTGSNNFASTTFTATTTFTKNTILATTSVNGLDVSSVISNSWILLNSTTTTATSTITLTIPTSTFLRIYVNLASTTTSGGSQLLRFNNDSSTNYFYWTKDLVVGSLNQANATSSIFWNGAGMTNVYAATLDITNVVGISKKLTGVSTADAGSSSTLTIWQGAGSWNNTSSIISSITFFNTANNNYVAGGKIFVYGNSNNQ